MSISTNRILIQVASAIRQTNRGTIVSLIRASKTSGPNPLQIPPAVEDPVIGAAAPIGVASLNILAAAASGALISGDQLTVDGNTYTITAQVESNLQGSQTLGFSSVPISPPLITAVNVDDAVVFNFLTVQQVFANIGSFSQVLLSNTDIQAADLRVTIAAWDLISGSYITAPTQTDTLQLNGIQYKIISVLPQYVGGIVAKYIVQARA